MLPEYLPFKEENPVMSPASKREYVEVIFLRYKKASRKLKTVILNEFCAACGYHRKYAYGFYASLNALQSPRSRRGDENLSLCDREVILKPLKCIWLAANLPSSKRLKAILPFWLPGYVQIYGKLPEKVCNALLKMSPSTIDRLLKPVRVR